MTMPNVQLRRASVEDLTQLKELWAQENLPSDLLEKRLKEIQIVEDPKGAILGMIGFEIAGNEGRLHHECYSQPEVAEDCRVRLWERAQIQAKNHGLVRIWTQLSDAFWAKCGLAPADDETLKKLPAPFAGEANPWSCIKLRDEKPVDVSVDKEFMMFREAEKEATQRIFRQAKVLKAVAIVLAVCLVILVVIWAVYFLRAQGEIRTL